MPYKSEATQITCDIVGDAEEGEGVKGVGEGGSAGLVELVEDRAQQRGDHLESVERAAA